MKAADTVLGRLRKHADSARSISKDFWRHDVYEDCSPLIAIVKTQINDLTRAANKFELTDQAIELPVLLKELEARAAKVKRSKSDDIALGYLFDGVAKVAVELIDGIERKSFHHSLMYGDETMLDSGAARVDDQINLDDIDEKNISKILFQKNGEKFQILLKDRTKTKIFLVAHRPVECLVQSSIRLLSKLDSIGIKIWNADAFPESASRTPSEQFKAANLEQLFPWMYAVKKKSNNVYKFKPTVFLVDKL